jgi:Zn-dependent M28 family amino/carboxypeptidase
VTLAVAAAAGSGRPADVGTGREVSAEAMQRHLAVLASDALEGRAAASTGGDRAAVYLAGELDRYGVEPLGDGGEFFQHVPLVGSVPLPSSRLRLWSLGDEIELRLGEDYLLSTTGDQTLIPRRVPMVFVGYGIVAPEHDYNDYEGLDVHDKVVVYLDGGPRARDGASLLGDAESVVTSPENKQRVALSRGAVGSVLVPWLGDDEEQGWQRLQRAYAFEHLNLAYDLPRHLSVVLRPEVAAGLFAEALYDLEQLEAMARANTMPSFYLPVELSFEGRFRTRTALAPNVVGLIQGSDPVLWDTYVVLSAHYDHLGVGTAVGGDAVYNGAVDNALGVAGVLELARVLSAQALRPSRSIVVLLTTAEEQGLLGARFFLDHTPMPRSQLVANVNVDGLAFQRAFSDVIVVGGELSSLGQTVKRASGARGLVVSPLPGPLRSRAEAFARSDQLAFAEAGVPAILINEGFSREGVSREQAVAETIQWLDRVYHTPADDLDQPLDIAAAARHAELILDVVCTVADARVAPAWKRGVSYRYRRLLEVARERTAGGRAP